MSFISVNLAMISDKESVNFGELPMDTRILGYFSSPNLVDKDGKEYRLPVYFRVASTMHELKQDNICDVNDLYTVRENCQ